MDEFERSVAVALRAAVPEPEHEIRPENVVELGRRRRSVALAGSAAAVLVAVLALVVSLTVPNRSRAPAASATTKPLAVGGLTFRLPPAWSSVAVGPQDARETYLSSRPFAARCREFPGGLCLPTVDRLAGDGVFARIETSNGRPSRSRPQIIDERRVDPFCPSGTASTTLVRYRTVVVVGCLGRSAGAKDAFLRFARSAR
jgi:hypothetical protein